MTMMPAHLVVSDDTEGIALLYYVVVTKPTDLIVPIWIHELDQQVRVDVTWMYEDFRSGGHHAVSYKWMASRTIEKFGEALTFSRDINVRFSRIECDVDDEY